MASMESPYNDRYDPEEDTYVYYQQPPLSHHYHQEFSEPQFYRLQPQPSSQPEMNFLVRVLSLFGTKGAFVAVAIAIGVVLFTHYQDDVRAWVAYYFPSDVALSDSLRVLALQSIQSIHGWIQYFFSGALLERLVEWTRQKRAGNLPREGGGGATRNLYNEALPQLELMPIQAGSVVIPDLGPRKSPQRPVAHMNTTELEPTFLREQDYPAAWVVYHRVLGVVKKAEAEEYDAAMETYEASEEESEGGDHFNEEKKDEPDVQSELDDEKTVHHSNVSRRRDNSASTNQDDSSSSSDNNPSAAYPVLHSIAASG